MDAADPPCTDAPTDPCWARMRDLPEPCEIWRAQHPERIVFPSPSDCGTGCRRIDLGLGWAGFWQGGWAGAGGDDYVVLFGGDPSSVRYQINALVRTDGRTAFAARYPSNGLVGAAGEQLCRAAQFEVGDGFGAFVVDWCFDADCRSSGERVYYGSLEELARVPTPIATFTGTPGLELAVSSRGIVWQGAGVIDGSPASFGSAMPFLDVFFPRLVGADVLWIDGSDELHVWSGGIDTTLLALPPSSAEVPLMTDGTTIVWSELAPYAGGGMSATLRAGPFVHDAAAFTARTLDGPGILALGGVMGGGRVAHEDHAAAMGSTPAAFLGYRVIEVATGVARRFVPPADEHPMYLHLVSDTELVVETYDRLGGAHLYLVDPSTLPPAT